MNVIKMVERGKFELAEYLPSLQEYLPGVEAKKAEKELLRLARLGQAMDWVDGPPPAFGAEDRKWIIFEHLTPFTKATVYMTAIWLGTSYSESKVRLARKWALMPLPPAPEVRE